MSQQNKPAPGERLKTAIAQVKKAIQEGKISPPKGFDVEAALSGVQLTLSNTDMGKDKGYINICDYVDPSSIFYAICAMIMEGVYIHRDHGNFLVMGKSMKWRRQYKGDIFLAMTSGNIVAPPAVNMVYKGDEFAYHVDPETGLKRVTKHVCNVEGAGKEIIAAYCYVHTSSGLKPMEIMTIDQIKMAWSKGFDSAPKREFPDQMAAKTVIRRALKHYTGLDDEAEPIQAHTEIEANSIEEISEDDL